MVVETMPAVQGQLVFDRQGSRPDHLRMIDLSGKVFIVTGGNGGIGLGMAEGIAMSGGSVAIWGRNTQKNADALDKLRAITDEHGGKASAYVCDVGDEQAIIDTMDQTVSDMGRMDEARRRYTEDTT